MPWFWHAHFWAQNHVQWLTSSVLWRRCGSTEAKQRTQIYFNECPAFYERTCHARESRKQRSDRPETQQRLGAPALGSGKLQTPPNRYPPARLLQLLFEAKPV